MQKNTTERIGLNVTQKRIVVMRQIAYGVYSESSEKYIETRNKTLQDCLNNFAARGVDYHCDSHVHLSHERKSKIHT